MLRGKRKNNKGRLTIGNLELKKQKSDEEIEEKEEEEEIEYEEYRNMKNYGNRVDGPWIFGISWYKSNEWKLINQRGSETRFFLCQ